MKKDIKKIDAPKVEKRHDESKVETKSTLELDEEVRMRKREHQSSLRGG